MDSPTYAILSLLQNVTSPQPGQWYARCPAHDDQKNSLGVTIGDEQRAVLNCLAGCTPVDILRTLGLGWSALFPERPEAPHKGNGSPGAKATGKPKLGKIVATYDYHDAAGALLFQVTRHDPKDFRQRRPDPAARGGFTWDMKGVARVLYRLPEILAAPPDGPIILCEGEKDADRLRSGGFTATTVPGGAGKWHASYGETLRGRHVLLLPDIDRPSQKTGKAPGWEHVAKVGNALLGIAASVRLIELPNTFTPPLTPKWDVSDWIDRGGTIEQFRAACDAARQWERVEQVGDSETSNEELVDPHRLARLFLATHSHPDGSTLRWWRETWQQWDGRKYIVLGKHEIKAAITSCCKSEFDRDNLQRLKNFIATDAKPLPPQTQKVTTAIVANVTQALAGIVLLPDATDPPTWLSGPPRKPRDFAALTNGILDTRRLIADGNDDLAPHSPAFFSPTCLPFDFIPGAECPKWLSFVDRNLESDPERIDMLQEWFGYNVTHDTSYQKFLLMVGEGSNGKSVICAALQALLGDANVSHLQLEKFGDEFAPTQMVGRLANIIPEIGEIDRPAEGCLKSFTSGDRMTFNRKNKDLIEAKPTARLTLATNNLPRFTDRSNGVWRRMILLPMKVQITDQEKVRGMDSAEWWADQGELPGIFNWALAGLHRLREQGGFTESAICSAALYDYRSESNPARSFLLERYREDIDGDIVTADTYKLYSDWCAKNGNRPLASVAFGKEIIRAFPKAEKAKVRSIEGNRVNGYRNIELKTDFDTDNPDNQDISCTTDQVVS